MIRKAEGRDFCVILDMCEQFWDHTSYSEPFEREHVMDMVRVSFDHGLLLVLDKGGVKGFVAGIKSPLLGSSQALAGAELAWWVDPFHRGEGEGVKLLRAIEEQAKKIGIKYWNMVSMRSSNDKHANEIYEKAGYKLNETVYQKVL